MPDPIASPESGGRLDNETLDPHLPDRINAAKRCGLERSAWLTGWFISWSPRNDNQNAEGTWDDWVELARRILAADEKAHTLSRASASL